MLSQSLYHTYKRYRTLQTDKITALPIVILMPHSACNCRCVMCDIWKDNQHLKQLMENDILDLLSSFKHFGTRQVVMSGGEALLNPNFFRFCEILKKENIKITLLSTGIILKKHATKVIEWVNDIIVSLDGDETTHDQIRNISGAYNKLKEGVHAIKSLKPRYKITGRSVIHRLNFRKWKNIIAAAKGIGLNQISFLPADVSSHAFNREVLWSNARQHNILPEKEELPELKNIIENIINDYQQDFENRFIEERPEKLRKIHDYYAAFYGLNSFPYKKCNAPWVSAVIEADGTVRPCFFHTALGNIHQKKFSDILNSNIAINFRKNLDIDTNNTCKKCVCYLNLPPGMNPTAIN
ncbi:MAG TPA: radical SAM protein [Chitinophagaceae bacterium]|nr:radical SAM protein [Chitinophagaceae bacterium]